MKKTYEKPLVAVENFVLSQAISACDIKIGLKNSQCVINDVDSTSHMVNYAATGWFLNTYCTNTAVDTDNDDKMCYHTSTGYGAFTST